MTVNAACRAACESPDCRSAPPAGLADPVGGLHRDPAVLTDRQLTDLLTSPLARCSGPGMDPDAWYPVARGKRARVQAAQAIALCHQCPVRLGCLEMSMRQWATGGQHGIWGGLLESERVRVHTAWRAGTPISGMPAGDTAGHSFVNRQVAARLPDLLTRERGSPRTAAAAADISCIRKQRGEGSHGQGQ
ncbi:MAG TPA: WhiB family transcriptional regulator [Streptosporangiaceae bacterium]|nr:WhiB family transcriptional regulator [Streptosporangiaceae bacterium]